MRPTFVIRHSSFVISHPLPYRPEVLQYIDERGEEVDEVVLATAANWRIAQHVAQQCDFVTHVLASDAETNLSGPAKLAAIRRLCGRQAVRLHWRSSHRFADLAGLAASYSCE